MISLQLDWRPFTIEAMGGYFCSEPEMQQQQIRLKIPLKQNLKINEVKNHN